MRGVETGAHDGGLGARGGQYGAAAQRDPAREHPHEAALVEEGRGREVGGDERRGQHQEPAGRPAEHGHRAEQLAGGRAGGGGTAAAAAPLPVHPAVDVGGGDENQDGGPHVQMQHVEQTPVLGHHRQRAQPHDVQRGDRDQPHRGAAQPRPPRGGVCEDGAHAQGHGVAPAAARVGVEQARRHPGELLRHPLLDLRERRQQGMLDPPEPHQAEQPDEPRADGQREPQRAAGFGRRLAAGGIGPSRLHQSVPFPALQYTVVRRPPTTPFGSAQDHPTLRHRRAQAESWRVMGRRTGGIVGLTRRRPTGRTVATPRIGGEPSRAGSVSIVKDADDFLAAAARIGG